MVGLHAGGTEFPVELTVTRSPGEPPRYTAWIRDLTEQRRAEAQLNRRTALLERAEQLAGMGSWEWNLETNELLWSQNRFRLFGVEPGDVIPSIEFLIEQALPADRKRLRRMIEIARRTGSMPPLEYRAVLPDGSVRHLRARSTLVEREAGGARRMIGTVEDLTDRRVAERETDAYAAVSEMLDRWESFERSAEALLRGLSEALDYEIAGLWIRDDAVFVNRLQWARAPEEVTEFTETTRRLRFPRGSGLIGRVWEAGEPLSLDNPTMDLAFRRRDAAGRLGIRGGLAVPAQSAEDMVAVLDSYSREEVAVTARLLRSLAAIGQELGRFLVQRQGELVPTRLTRRELEILQLAAHGLSRPEVAERLIVSPATVKTHFENIYAKLGVSDKAAAVATALRQGLIE
jgi:PAS domain S-box-containing protein